MNFKFNRHVFFWFIILLSFIIENRAGHFYLKAIAGNTTGSAGDGLLASKTILHSPAGVWGDSNGNLYVTESTGGNRIRKLSIVSYSTYKTNIVIGTGIYNNSGSEGPALTTGIEGATGIYGNADASLLYFSTNKYYLFLYNSSTKFISKIAGSATNLPQRGFNGDGPAIGTELNQPIGLYLTSGGILYFADSANNLIREVSGNQVTTIAGNSTSGFCVDNVPATQSCLTNPSGVWVDPSGVIYIADTGNNRFRTVFSNIIRTFSGTGNTTYNGDYLPLSAVNYNVPLDIKGDSSGILYLAELGRIRIVEHFMVKCIAGNGFIGSPSYTAALATGSPVFPSALWVDSLSNIFYTDSRGYVVQIYAVNDPSSAPSGLPTGVPSVTFRYGVYYLKTIAGKGFVVSDSGDGGPALQSGLHSPRGIWQDSTGNLYVGESLGSVIRKISASSGIITTVAGTGRIASSGGSGSARNVTLDGVSGIFGTTNVIVFTGSSFFVWEYSLSLGGYVTVIGGKIPGNLSYGGDNIPALNSSFNHPAELFVSSNLIYLADSSNHRIRTIDRVSGIVQTIAGNGTEGFSGDGQDATVAMLNTPFSVWVDSNGDFCYIADTFNNRIRAFLLSNLVNTIETYAGTGAYAGDTGPVTATLASFRSPYSIKGDTAGNLYIADTYNYLIRMIDYLTKIVTIIAGMGTVGIAPTSMQLATSVRLNSVFNLWINSEGSIYFTEPANGYIRQILKFSSPSSQPSSAPSVKPSSSPSAAIRPGNYYLKLLAGNGIGDTDGGDNGPAVSASFNNPSGLWGDSMGTLYVGELSGNRIRCINRLQIISTCFGTGIMSNAGGSGAASNVNFDGVSGIIGNETTLYISGEYYFLWQTKNNSVNRIAGKVPGNSGYNGDGLPSLLTELNYPRGLYLDSLGSLYFCDSSNHIVRVVSPDGIINTVAGVATSSGFSNDGTNATLSLLNTPSGLWMNSLLDLFVADTGNNRVRVIRNNRVYSVAGNGLPMFSGDGHLAVNAGLHTPLDVKGDTMGNLFIADSENCRVRLVNATGFISTFIGSGRCGSDYAMMTELTAAHLGAINSLWLNSEGSLYLLETQGFVRQVIYLEFPSSSPSVSPSATPSTFPTVAPSARPSIASIPYYLSIFAGLGGCASSSGDGGPATSANISGLAGIWGDSTGNLYLCETSDHRVRQVSNNSIIQTIIGSGSFSLSGVEGPALTTPLDGTYGIAGNNLTNILYISSGASFIWKYDSNTQGISRYAGAVPASNGHSGDGGPAISAHLDQPLNMFLDTLGSLYFADSATHLVRRILPNGTIEGFAGNGSAGFNGDADFASLASLNLPTSIWQDSAGRSFIADSNNHRIRVVRGNGRIYTEVGNGFSTFNGDGLPATSTNLNSPRDVKGDKEGVLYIAEYTGARIRRVANDIVFVIAGTGGPSLGISASSIIATSVAIGFIKGLWVNSMGEVFVSSATACQVYKLSTTLPPQPSIVPSGRPSTAPSDKPSVFPTSFPSSIPTTFPSGFPSTMPSSIPSDSPSGAPSSSPTSLPSLRPRTRPSSSPTASPSSVPSSFPIAQPSEAPSAFPTTNPNALPSSTPSTPPSQSPTSFPSNCPTSRPSDNPVVKPSQHPSADPTMKPSHEPLSHPTSCPTIISSIRPTLLPSPASPTNIPTSIPTGSPTSIPTGSPTSAPTFCPSSSPSSFPTLRPFAKVKNITHTSPGFIQNLFLFGLFIPSVTTETTRPVTVNFSRPVKQIKSVVVLGTRNGREAGKKVIQLSSEASYDYATLPAPVLYQGSSSRAIAVLTSADSPSLLIGSPLTSSATLFFSESTTNSTSYNAWFSLFGESKNDFFGWAVASAGDMNQDGREDLLISAVYRGDCYVIYGKDRGNDRGDVWMQNLTSSEGFRILGGGKSVFSAVGIAVAGLGDLNGDSFDDMALSVLSASSQSMVIVLFGRNASSFSPLSDILLSDLLTSSGTTNTANSISRPAVGGLVITAAATVFCGQSIAAVGDVNGDGYADLAIGLIPLSQTVGGGREGKAQEKAYVIYGSNSSDRFFVRSLPLSNLSAEQGVEIDGGGFMVAGIGDVTGDGLNDVLVIDYEAWQGKSNAYLIRFPLPSSISLAPSPRPSSFPSHRPSLRPSSAAPSVPSGGSGGGGERSRAPTNTLSPVLRSSASNSSHHSLTPSVQSESLRPTIAPSKKVLSLITPAPVASSFPPSESPSKSLSPSIATTSPSSPSSILTSNINSSFEIFFGQNGSSQVILLHSNELRPEISIYGGSGRKIYVIYPKEATGAFALRNVILIHDFNRSEDILDISHLLSPIRFTSIASLSFSTNPLTFFFPNQEEVILLGHDSFDLTTQNFFFAPETAGSLRGSAVWIGTAALLVPSLLGFLLCVCAMIVSSHEHQNAEKEEKVWWQRISRPVISSPTEREGGEGRKQVLLMGLETVRPNPPPPLQQSHSSLSSPSPSDITSEHFVSFSDRSEGNFLSNPEQRSSSSSHSLRPRSSLSTRNDSYHSTESEDYLSSVNDSDCFELLDV